MKQDARTAGSTRTAVNRTRSSANGAGARSRQRKKVRIAATKNATRHGAGTDVSVAHQKIADRICDLLKDGKIPWKLPWSEIGAPKNLVSGNAYQGINVFSLAFHGFSSPWFLTFHQLKAMGGHLEKGTKGFPIVFWKMFDVVDDNGEMKKVPFLRRWTVFNVRQCKGIEQPDQDATARPHEPIAEAQQVWDNWRDRPKFNGDGDRAYYQPSLDKLTMPPMNRFDEAEGYYRVLFHEMGHATGHKSRLDRKEGMKGMSGLHAYSKEELVAEMTAAFLGQHAGIDNDQSLTNHAAYIQSWLRVLQSNPKWVQQAGSFAQKAFNHIIGIRKGEQDGRH